MPDNDLLDVINSDLRGDDGQDAFVLRSVGHQNGLVGLEPGDDLLQLSGDGSVGANPDFFVPREDGNFHFVFLTLPLNEVVVLGEGPQNSVRVALFGVGDAQLEGGREDVASTDDGAADGGLDAKVVVSVNGQHQGSCHRAPLGGPTDLLSFKPLC